MRNHQIDVSIIIVNWNTCDVLRDCLASVYANTRNIQVEVIVVDNGSDDNSMEMVKREFPDVVLIQNTQNRGFATANNQGITVAKGRYILLLNSDTIVLDGALDKVVAFADSSPESGIVTCGVLNKDRTLQLSCFMFPSVLNLFLWATYLSKLFPKSRFFGRERMTWWNRDDVRDVDVATGCFMLVRRQAIEQIGLLDERFFMYFEEADWCYRFKKAGWKILFTPSAEIIHLGGASTKQAGSKMALEYVASMLRFFKKHKSWLSYRFACLLLALCFFLRAPYWLGRVVCSKNNRSVNMQRAKNLTVGALRALLGFGPDKTVETISGLVMAGIDIICFGGEDWWYHNRGHIDMQLMRRFSRLGTAIYVNSVVMQKPRLSEGRKFLQKLVRKAKSIFSGLKKVDAGFWVYSPFSLPVHHISWARGLNQTILRHQIRRVTNKLGLHQPVVWVACPAACDIAIKMKKSKLVYQRTDRYEEYPNVDRSIITEYDRKLKISADLTIFVSHTLYEQERSQCRRAFFLDHGVDYDMFAGAEQDLQKPEDIASIAGPIVGFFGGIDDHTSDIGFMERVVDLLPEMSFVFIGNTSSDCSRLMSKKNVRMLGQKPYERIPHYGKCFDVAIMPWRQNRWIEACNPIKLKEYLALGKPVVSTPFPELRGYRDVVYEARTPEEFSDRIRQAITEDCPERIAARKEKVRNARWDCKAKLVLEELFGRSCEL